MNVVVAPEFLPKTSPAGGFRVRLTTSVGDVVHCRKILELWASLDEPAARVMAQRLAEEELAQAIAGVESSIQSLLFQMNRPAPSFDLPHTGAEHDREP